MTKLQQRTTCGMKRVRQNRDKRTKKCAILSKNCFRVVKADFISMNPHDFLCRSKGKVDPTKLYLVEKLPCLI